MKGSFQNASEVFDCPFPIGIRASIADRSALAIVIEAGKRHAVIITENELAAKRSNQSLKPTARAWFPFSVIHGSGLAPTR